MSASLLHIQFPHKCRRKPCCYQKKILCDYVVNMDFTSSQTISHYTHPQLYRSPQDASAHSAISSFPPRYRVTWSASLGKIEILQMLSHWAPAYQLQQADVNDAAAIANQSLEVLPASAPKLQTISHHSREMKNSHRYVSTNNKDGQHTIHIHCFGITDLTEVTLLTTYPESSQFVRTR